MKYFDQVVFCRDAEEFLETLEEKTRNKVLYNIRKAQYVRDESLFKKLNNDIWEFRTLYKRQRIRLFAFKYKEKNIVTIVVATHGIIKDTSKVPKRELDKAKGIRQRYLKDKNLNK